jgi:excisionase family DNA binding protein
MRTPIRASDAPRASNGDELDAYTIAEVCRRSGLGRSYVYEAIRRGELIARKFGRLTRVLPGDFCAWLDAAPRISPAHTRVPSAPDAADADGPSRGGARRVPSQTGRAPP